VEKRFQEQLQTIYSKQELQKLYYCISFGQTSENKLELELNFKKDIAFVSFSFAFTLKSDSQIFNPI